ncbi:ABC transporter permease [Streptomyces sp. NPDC052503]|uniref:ABC transporter permease n=1 Tax=Streptomyces sp. NPDC052503 TaxID=3156683 RepID=UPI00136D0AD1|nr:ABC transporter permease [Streptomyces sp. SID7834]MYT60731.1 ABC transporter permease [Streptomyces sp. SID7834]
MSRTQSSFATQAISCWKTSFLSFRALFNWLAPGQFVLAMVATPIMELLFFAFLGSNLGVEDARFFLLGGAMLAACTPSIAGGVMALTSERHFGTLEHILASRRSRIYLLLMRAVPYSFMGVVASVLTLMAGMAVLQIPLAPGEFLAFVALLFFGCLSSAFFGMALGVLGLVASNVFLLMNVAISTISIGAALIVPLAVLPAWVRLASHVLPLRHVAEAVRGMGAQGFGDRMLWNVGSELLVAAGWALVMLASFSWLESMMRRKG